MINILQNPFALLGATIQDPPDTLRKLAQEAVAAGSLGEAEADGAAEMLLNPETRLAAEVSWLLGRSVPRVRAILSALREAPDTAGRLALLETIDGVAKANLAAHLCAVERGGVSIVRAMVEAQNEISAEAVFWLVNGNRERAGFLLVEGETLAAALEALQAQHCAAVCEAISAREAHRKFMVRLFADGWSPEGPAYTFLERVVAAYNAWYDAHLEAIERDLKRHCQVLASEPDNREAADGVKSALALWDEYSEPLRGQDRESATVDARADAMHGHVSKLCFHLARNCGRYRAALQLSESLRYAFPGHPPVDLKMPEDLHALGPLMGRLRLDSPPRKLAERVLELNRDHAGLAAGLAGGGFQRGDRTAAGQLYLAFTECTGETFGTASVELVWVILRCLALDLHQRHGHTAGALALVEAILAQGEDYDVPSEIRRMLENDADHLRFSGERAIIERLMARGRWRKAARRVEALLLDPPTESAREELVALQATIRAQGETAGAPRPVLLAGLVLLMGVIVVLILASW